MCPSPDLEGLTAAQLREMVVSLQSQISDRDARIEAHDALLAKRDRSIHQYKIREQQLTHEIALLKRYQFGRRSEELNRGQLSLLQEQIDEDISAVETELEKISVSDKPKAPTSQPKRQTLPPELPRTIIAHEPQSTTCACGCELQRIGEDVSEKLDYTPGTFQVERHIRGKWACRTCDTLIQEPVAPHIIDKGIPTTHLLAQVLVSKYADHQPLYRQQQIYARAGVDIPRSTLSDWVGRCGVELTPLITRLREVILQHGVLHADETPVSMLAPGKKRTHRAYVWTYTTTRYADIPGVIYDFRPSRAGKEVKIFLQDWTGKLVCDDYTGYKALFGDNITEIGCMAHARRKFHDLHVANQSPIAEKALATIGLLYGIERETVDLDADGRHRVRQTKARPIADKLHAWLIGHRANTTDGTGLARAIDYSLKRWAALTRYLDDGTVPIDNNWVENQIRPWALGRSNWLFAGSLRSGQRAANIMSLVQSAKINGLAPQAYLKDVMDQLPIIKYAQIDNLLSHNWNANFNRG